MAASSEGFCEVNGARLFHQAAGSGHPLVLIHAGIASMEMWDPQFLTFADSYHVVRYDLRGYGRSEMVAGEYSHLDDLVGLLDHLRIESAHLIGCSKGAGLAFDFAVSQSQRTSALISVAGDPAGLEIDQEPSPPPLWSEVVAAFEAGDLERCAELDVRLWVDGAKRTPDQVPAAIRDKVRAMDLIALRNEMAGLGKERPLQPPAGKRLSEIAAPVLLITGELDDPFMEVAARLVSQQLPSARWERIADAAHLPNMEKPEEFNRLVLDFLAEVGARS